MRAIVDMRLVIRRKGMRGPIVGGEEDRRRRAESDKLESMRVSNTRAHQ